uniref:Uncharacterized protein n=1 Tax=Myoviridae sp. ct3it16 TaxID=2825027 RepID=A0A8S5PGP3_9CAUD|nr:MAG TPA: hypothetical protein [Myoviridae sp. ct3it16]
MFFFYYSKHYSILQINIPQFYRLQCTNSTSCINSQSR